MRRKDPQCFEMLGFELTDDVVVAHVNEADEGAPVEERRTHHAAEAHVDDAFGGIEILIVEGVPDDDGGARFHDMADDGVRKQVVVYRFLIEVARDLAVNLAVTDEQEKPLVGVDEANDVVDGVGQDGIDAAFLREVFGESLKLAKCPEDVLVIFLPGAIRRGVLGVKGETHAERADGEFVLVRKRRFFLYFFILST